MGTPQSQNRGLCRRSYQRKQHPAKVTGEMTGIPPSFEEIRRKAITDLAAAHPEVLAS
jgi:hypothetical protein